MITLVIDSLLILHLIFGTVFTVLFFEIVYKFNATTFMFCTDFIKVLIFLGCAFVGFGVSKILSIIISNVFYNRDLEGATVYQEEDIEEDEEDEFYK